MAFIDVIIIGLAVLGAVRGCMYGLTAGLGTVFAILAGVAACRFFGDGAYDVLARHTDAETYPGAPYTGTVLAYILVFVPVYAAGMTAGHLAKKLLAALRLGGIDRIGGGIFGALKYLLALSVVLNAIYALAPGSGIFNSSHLLGGAVFKAVMGFAPYLWGLDIFPDLG